MSKELFKTIRNDEQYEKVLERIDELIDMEDSQHVNDEIEILALLVSEYEKTHYPIKIELMYFL